MKTKKYPTITLTNPDGTTVNVQTRHIRGLEERDPADKEAVWKSIGIIAKSRLRLPGGLVITVKETVSEVKALILKAEKS